VTTKEREIIRKGVIRLAIEGSADFGEIVQQLQPALPGRSFKEILNHVERTWRRERSRRE